MVDLNKNQQTNIEDSGDLKRELVWYSNGCQIWMPNGLVFECHLNTRQLNHLDTRQMDAILFCYWNGRSSIKTTNRRAVYYFRLFILSLAQTAETGRPNK